MGDGLADVMEGSRLPHRLRGQSFAPANNLACGCPKIGNAYLTPQFCRKAPREVERAFEKIGIALVVKSE